MVVSKSTLLLLKYSSVNALKKIKSYFYLFAFVFSSAFTEVQFVHLRLYNVLSYSPKNLNNFVAAKNSNSEYICLTG